MHELWTLGALTLRSPSAGNRPGIQAHRLAAVALLAEAGEQGVSRDTLLGYLWADREPSSARHCLSQALYALRRDLGSDRLLVGTARLRLNPDVIGCDLWVFRRALRAGRWQEAVDAYGGPFLGGFHLREAPEFERWMDRVRATLVDQFHTAVDRLATDAAASGDHGAAVSYRRRALAASPHNGRAAAELARALAAAGSPAVAISEIHAFGQRLREDLALPLSTDLIALADEIREARVRRPAPGPAPRAPDSEAASGAALKPALEPAGIVPAERGRRRWWPARAITAALGVSLFVTNGAGRDGTLSARGSARIPVEAAGWPGEAPGPALNPARAGGRFAHVANHASNDVSVIDLVANAVVATIPVGTWPFGMAFTPDGAFAYVANVYSDDVSAIDLATNTVVATIPLAPQGRQPARIAIRPDGAFGYVTNQVSGNVSVIDLSANKVIGSIPVGGYPVEIAITPDGAFAYVTNSSGGSVSVIDLATNLVVGSIPVGGFVGAIAFSPDGASAYVVSDPDQLSVIDVATRAVVASATVGLLPRAIAITPDGASAYVANHVTADVSVLDLATNTVARTIPVGTRAHGIAIAPTGTFAYVANVGGHLPGSQANFVSVIDLATDTVVGTIEVGSGPQSVAIPFVPVGIDSKPGKVSSGSVAASVPGSPD